MMQEVSSSSSSLRNVLPHILSFIPKHLDLRTTSNEWNDAIEILHSTGNCRNNCHSRCSSVSELGKRWPRLSWVRNWTLFQDMNRFESVQQYKALQSEDSSLIRPFDAIFGQIATDLQTDFFPLITESKPNFAPSLSIHIKAYYYFDVNASEIRSFAAWCMQQDVLSVQITSIEKCVFGTDANFIEFVNDPKMKPLKSLIAHGHPASTAAYASLASPSSQMVNLRTLSLLSPASYVKIGAAHMACLTGGLGPRSHLELQSLDLENLGLNDAAFAALAASPFASKLTHLRLCSNPVTNRSIATLCSPASSRMTNLKSLTIASYPFMKITDTGIAQLVTNEHVMKTLTSLAFVSFGSGFGFRSLLHVLSSPYANQIQSLTLMDCGIDADGIEVLLSRASDFHSLTHLSLGLNMAIDDETAVKISQCRALFRLKDLDVRFCAVGKEGVAALFSSTCFRQLESLNIQPPDTSPRPFDECVESALVGIEPIPSLRKIFVSEAAKEELTAAFPRLTVTSEIIWP